jgi:hypothetical protein
MYQSYASSADSKGPCVPSCAFTDKVHPVWSALMVARCRRDLKAAVSSRMLARLVVV